MGDKKQTSFTFEINNFTEKEAGRRSPHFLAGGCEWYIQVYSNGLLVDDHLSMNLSVANPDSLGLGWKRQASFSFVLLNQSGKELYRTKELCALFCAQLTTAWARSKALPLEKLQEKGFLENKKLIVKVEVKVIEVIDEAEEVTWKKLDVHGFKILHSQAVRVSKLFKKHPDIAVNFKTKNLQVETTYIAILLHLIETLKKPPHSISETELWIAGNELMELTEAGFKLDWLKTKLQKVSFKKRWKTSYDNVSRVQEFEKQVKNLKGEVSLERKTTYDNCSRVRKLEKQVKNLKAELNIEKEKSATYATKLYALEKTVSDIIEVNKKWNSVHV